MACSEHKRNKIVFRYLRSALPFFVAIFSMIGLVFPFTVLGLAEYRGDRMISVGLCCSGISSPGSTSTLNWLMPYVDSLSLRMISASTSALLISFFVLLTRILTLG